MTYRQLLSFLLTLLLFLTSCNEEYVIKPKDTIELNNNRILWTSIEKENQLVPVLNNIGFFQSTKTQFSNARSSSSGFQIDVNQFLKVLQSDSLNHAYTFKLLDSDSSSNSFSNLIIEELNEGYLGYILQYDSDSTISDFSGFSGTLRRYDLDGALLSEKNILNGHLVKNSSSNGRVLQTAYCVTDINTYYECVEYGKIFDSSSQTYKFGCLKTEAVIEIVVEPCADGGGGGSGDTGGTYIPPTSGTGSGSGTSDPQSGGSGSSGGSSTIGVISNNLVLEQLEQIVLDNPAALLDIPCSELPKWQTLAQHKSSLNIRTKINQLQTNNNSIFDEWAIQTLNGAKGTIANMDYFSVSVSVLPNNPATGTRFSPEGFLDHFRRNIDNFVEGSTFSPYCELPSICTQETALWNSANPTGALVYIDIPGDDGVVVCSNYTPSYWYFVTLEAPGAGNHPVSGVRQFGFEANANGGYNFFVRGVDRFDSNIVENTLYIATLGQNPFFGADALWTSFQNKMNQYINYNGGSASINVPIKYRPDWDKVKDILEGVRPISDLGCD